MERMIPPPFRQRIPYGPEPSQFYELWLPEGPLRGAILAIHGGLWLSRYELSHLNPICADLAAEGFVVANLEYRRVGNPGGGWPGSFEDVLTGFKAARSAFPDLPWKVLGHSAGGHLALLLGCASQAMEAVLALAPVSCMAWPPQSPLCQEAIADFLGGDQAEIPETYREACPSERASTVPRFLIHGTADDMVPVEMSRHFLSKRQADPGPVNLLEIAGADHFQLIDPASNAWHTIRAQATARQHH